jgi:hypothetical protein
VVARRAAEAARLEADVRALPAAAAAALSLRAAAEEENAAHALALRRQLDAAGGYHSGGDPLLGLPAAAVGGDYAGGEWAEAAHSSLGRRRFRLDEAEEARQAYLACSSELPAELVARRRVVALAARYHAKRAAQHWLEGTGQESAGTERLLRELRAARAGVTEVVVAEAARLQVLRDVAEADDMAAGLRKGPGEDEGEHVGADGIRRPKLKMAYEVRRRKVQQKVWPGWHTGQRPAVRMGDGDREIDVPLPAPRVLQKQKAGAAGARGREAPAPEAPTFDGWAGLKKKPKAKLMIGGVYGEF